MSSGYLKQVDIRGLQNNATVANGVNVDSAIFSIEGSDRVDFYAFLDRNAATALTFTLLLSPDRAEDAAADMFTEHSVAVVAGVGTLSSLTAVKSGIAGDVRFHFGFTGLNARSALLRVSSTAGDTDTITIQGLRAVPAAG